MDNLDNLRTVIIESLGYYANLCYATGEVNRLLIVDQDSDNYLILLEGWENRERVHGCLVHLQIIDHKIWIQRDGIEDGIATDLMEAGIPKEQIVLAFKPEHIRPYTEFAVK
ncbi:MULTISPECIES: XisI protein [Okeania]|uniref:XisI protein n=1 Tax=Okeania TaxID=1458928 RepID=UPI000F547948|nr:MULTISPECIES: XisI protein [Okeania]NEP07290.1 XisI protein [Okeania sp. SIO4D6]NEP38427.1 XisI protein [Okeania sp. SIO2H7]NET16212.1 XisI protein [Okeania sp. SIO1H6]NEP72456.1 XisI protein [Okeania sp. SIO2G5]NEP93117.1 XisI protein [Okeania sp. SIO2F5]